MAPAHVSLNFGCHFDFLLSGNIAQPAAPEGRQDGQGYFASFLALMSDSTLPHSLYVETITCGDDI